MNSLVMAATLFVCALGSALLGMAIQRRLPKQHLSTESKDAIKQCIGLVATMTALILGLLTASAKGTYDQEKSQVTQMAVKIMYLDRVLALYGPEAGAARASLRSGLLRAI
jgi:hypothetical protein